MNWYTRLDIISNRIAFKEYATMRRLGYSSHAAYRHAMWIRADFWRIAHG